MLIGQQGLEQRENEICKKHGSISRQFSSATHKKNLISLVSYAFWSWISKLTAIMKLDNVRQIWVQLSKPVNHIDTKCISLPWTIMRHLSINACMACLFQTNEINAQRF